MPSLHTHFTVIVDRRLAMATFAEVHPCGVCLGPGVEAVLEQLSMQHKAVTFDEITLADQPSSFHPADVRLQTFISRNIALDGCGICSAAMVGVVSYCGMVTIPLIHSTLKQDSVTEGVLALEMARNGGMGIVHRNLSAEEQVCAVLPCAVAVELSHYVLLHCAG